MTPAAFLADQLRAAERIANPVLFVPSRALGRLFRLQPGAIFYLPASRPAAAEGNWRRYLARERGVIAHGCRAPATCPWHRGDR